MERRKLESIKNYKKIKDAMEDCAESERKALKRDSAENLMTTLEKLLQMLDDETNNRVIDLFDRNFFNASYYWDNFNYRSPEFMNYSIREFWDKLLKHDVFTYYYSTGTMAPIKFVGERCNKC